MTLQITLHGSTELRALTVCVVTPIPVRIAARNRLKSLAAMARPGAVLLLLLVTSAAAVRYRWLDPVSLPTPAVQILSAESEIDCGLFCEGATPEECTGFIYGPDDGACRLFSGDCRGPAVVSSQLNTERYMARYTCPGSVSDPCACPAGFSRCAGRCLKRLDLAVTYGEAESQCAALGAHLAVPRSDEENQCAIDAAGTSYAWLGFNDAVTENQFVADDGCDNVPGDSPFWAEGQPNNYLNQSHGALVPVPTSGTPEAGWHDVAPSSLYRPLCQLAYCYNSNCP
ncbi:brevican core protein-like isoform X1 [Amphibalanus amphitrite]|uniref:brevican core protein-like isoform X1 n=1 Tax=Amphibalanus amphitrite TaxID=1232801 RepID=UPI001C912BE0|nr:brevican core protein-like isoform X1 [Amphibalanus amphitrite]